VIIKKQREIGIKKALGFSSDQLRTELIFSMLPQIIVGAVVGSVIGLLISNRILATLLSTMGIMRSNMEVFPWMGLVAVVFAVIVSYIMIWLMSGRIKRISAYSLITE
jgi:ABC-type antimicrobial peptide transport system permease subunit